MNRYPSKFHISTHSCLIRVYMSQSSCIYTGHLVISPCHSMLVCFSLIKDGKSTCTFSFGSSFLHLGCQSPSQHLTEDHVYLSTWNSYWVNGAEVHFSLVTRLCLTLCSPMDCSTPGFPVHHQLLELAQTHVHQAGDAIQPFHPLLSLSPSIFPSIRVFSNESVLCIREPKYWSFSFSISPCNEYSGLISFKMEWLDLLAVQGTLKSYPIP